MELNHTCTLATQKAQLIQVSSPEMMISSNLRHRILSTTTSSSSLLNTISIKRYNTLDLGV